MPNRQSDTRMYVCLPYISDYYQSNGLSVQSEWDKCRFSASLQKKPVTFCGHVSYIVIKRRCNLEELTSTIWVTSLLTSETGWDYYFIQYSQCPWGTTGAAPNAAHVICLASIAASATLAVDRPINDCSSFTFTTKHWIWLKELGTKSTTMRIYKQPQSTRRHLVQFISLLWHTP